MNFLASVRTAMLALRRNKLRSALAMVGIVIAVSAVVATVAIGEGAKVRVAQEMASLGLNMLTVSPGAVSSHGASTGAGGTQTLTLDDAQAIVQSGTNLSMVGLADEAERWLGKPVIAVNTATFWDALRRVGIRDQLEGFGSLLREL